MKPLVLLTLMISSTVLARERDDFNSILKRVESHYGKRHMRLPLMGLISFTSLMTRPMGVSGLRLAVIEGVGSRHEGIPDFHPGPEWQPVIRTTSRNGERMVMYGREDGTAIRALMVAIEKNEAVVLQMRLDPARFAKLVAEKSEIAERHGGTETPRKLKLAPQ